MPKFSSKILTTICLPVFLVGVFSLTTKPTYAGSAPNPKLVERLGKDLFFDDQLSEPVGMSCATCHAPETGFSYPISEVNKKLGPVPGIVPGRFGNRVPPTAAYAAYLLQGLPKYDPNLATYVGGMFWDGRAANLTAQAEAPFLNPNEMDNLIHNVAAPQQVVEKVKNGRYAELFKETYGKDIFSQSTTVVYTLVAETIAAFEASPEVCQFSSKYDAYLLGKARLTPAELDGLRLVTGSVTGRPGGAPYYKNAQCGDCHGIPSDPSTGRDLFTNTCYANDGVPKNPNNPYYTETNEKTDPIGYNAAGADYIDIGLGDFLYPYLGLPSGDFAEGDPLAIDGTFKAPTLRNADKRPYPGFVKAYFHNGVFKDLKQVVHFYNTRNLTTHPGEVIDFTQTDPYAHLKGKPLWPAPEFISAATLQNPQGLPNSSNNQLGNLGLTDKEEDDIVAFLKTLSDGYFDPSCTNGRP